METLRLGTFFWLQYLVYCTAYMGGRKQIMLSTYGAPRGRGCPHLIDTHLQNVHTKGGNHDYSVSSSRARYPRASYHRLDAEAIRSSSASSSSPPTVTVRSVGAMLRPLPSTKNPPPRQSMCYDSGSVSSFGLSVNTTPGACSARRIVTPLLDRYWVRHKYCLLYTSPSPRD